MEEGEPHSTSNTSTSNDSSSAPESPATLGDPADNAMESDTSITHPGKWTVRLHSPILLHSMMSDPQQNLIPLKYLEIIVNMIELTLLFENL